MSVTNHGLIPALAPPCHSAPVEWPIPPPRPPPAWAHQRGVHQGWGTPAWGPPPGPTQILPEYRGRSGVCAWWGANAPHQADSRHPSVVWEDLGRAWWVGPTLVYPTLGVPHAGVPTLAGQGLRKIIFTHRHPGQPLTHRRSVTHAPPPPGPAQILHQNTEGDLECVSGGGAKPPTRQTVVIPLYFGGESGLGLGVGGHG